MNAGSPGSREHALITSRGQQLTVGREEHVVVPPCRAFRGALLSMRGHVPDVRLSPPSLIASVLPSGENTRLPNAGSVVSGRGTVPTDGRTSAARRSTALRRRRCTRGGQKLTIGRKSHGNRIPKPLRQRRLKWLESKRDPCQTTSTASGSCSSLPGWPGFAVSRKTSCRMGPLVPFECGKSSPASDIPQRDRSLVGAHGHRVKIRPRSDGTCGRPANQRASSTARGAISHSRDACHVRPAGTPRVPSPERTRSLGGPPSGVHCRCGGGSGAKRFSRARDRRCSRRPG